MNLEISILARATEKTLPPIAHRPLVAARVRRAAGSVTSARVSPWRTVA